MNATIQTLHVCTQLKDTLFKKVYASSFKTNFNDKLSEEIARVFTMQLSSVSKPTELLEAICSISSCKHYAKREQQDCCEFLIKLMEYWSETNKDLSDLFEGGTRSLITCSQCNESSYTWDRFMVLKLSLEDQLLQHKRPLSIEDLISRWKREELLSGDNGYSCMHCNVTTESVKKLDISNSPPILITQIKRFEYTAEGKGVKLKKNVEFNEKLNITVDTLHGGMEVVTYNLKAVVTHIGETPSGGHYTATTRLDSTSNNWHNYSDIHCKPMSFKQVKKQQAYLLFYEKDMKTRMDQVGDDISFNTLPISNILFNQPCNQTSKVRLFEVPHSDTKLLGGTGPKKKATKKKENNKKRKPAKKKSHHSNPGSQTREPQTQNESSNVIQNISSETFSTTASLTTNVQTTRKRKVRKNVTQVDKDQDECHSGKQKPITTIHEEPLGKRKRRKTATKQKVKKKRKPVKKKKSKGKKKPVELEITKEKMN